MPECQNCGNVVSDRYARVMGRDGVVEACPECPDLVRDRRGRVRERRDHGGGMA